MSKTKQFMLKEERKVKVPKVIQIPASVTSEPAPTSIQHNEQSSLEKAIEMLIISNTNQQSLLSKMNDTMEKVAEGIDKINTTAKENVEHQVDLDQINKTKPFKIQMLYQIDQRTIDLGDGIYEFESTGRSFKTKEEAVTFWTSTFWQGMFRIVEVEMPISQS